MVEVNNRFSFERDRYCWHLHDHYVGKDKKGNPKIQKRTTYHADLSQVAHHILDRSAGECKSLTEILDLLKSAHSVVTGSLADTSERQEQ